MMDLFHEYRGSFRTRYVAAAVAFFATTIAAPLLAETLKVSPPLAKDVAALPRLAADTTVATSVNAALEDLDKSHFGIMTCDGENPDSAYRSVEILSDGPAFLSLFVIVGGYCQGAAHPWNTVETVNFDLATGQASDLRDYLPKAWSGPDKADEPLFTLYVESLDPSSLLDGCLDALVWGNDEKLLSFYLGVDQKAGKLMLLPTGLPYAASGCQTAAFASVDQLRAAGFHADLINILESSP
jgi:hypothetical protein